MDADDSFEGDREKRKGVAFSKVFCGGKGKLRQIFQAGDVPWMHSGFLKFLTVEGGPFEGMLDRPPQAFQLKLSQFIFRFKNRHEGLHQFS